MTGLPAVVALGGNLGDRAATLDAAIAAMAELEGVELVRVSSFLETPALRPDGIDGTAPPYLNAVALVTTTLSPERLLGALLRIEQAHGRVRSERWGDRTLDLDLIDVGGRAYRGDGVTLPHPSAHERLFVLVPWLEVDPDAKLTGHGPIAGLVERLRAATPEVGV